MAKFKKFILAILMVLVVVGAITFSSGISMKKTIILNQNNIYTQHSNIKLSLIRKLQTVDDLSKEIGKKFDKNSNEYKTFINYKNTLLNFVELTEEGEMMLKRNLTDEEMIVLYRNIINYNLDEHPKVKDKLSNDIITNFVKADSDILNAFKDYNELVDVYNSSKETFLGNLIKNMSNIDDFEKFKINKE